jgi:hypothetical protein
LKKNVYLKQRGHEHVELGHVEGAGELEPHRRDLRQVVDLLLALLRLHGRGVPCVRVLVFVVVLFGAVFVRARCFLVRLIGVQKVGVNVGALLEAEVVGVGDRHAQAFTGVGNLPSSLLTISNFFFTPEGGLVEDEREVHDAALGLDDRGRVVDAQDVFLHRG